MGAHVSAVPNGQTGRCAGMETRGVVAMSGTFGYEMDLGKTTREEKDVIQRQVAFFKEHYDLFQRGDYYRLTDPFQNGPYTAWEHVSPDRREALVSLVSGPARASQPFQMLRLKGLDPALTYQIDGEGRWPGDVLLEAGWPVPVFRDDYQCVQLYLSAI